MALSETASSKMASAKMASLIEFYLTTLWKYKPTAIERVIQSLPVADLANVEILYDYDYHWFKVICFAHQAQKVRQVFDRIVREIEDEAFGDDGGNILDDNDQIKTHFNNEWISDEPEQASGAVGKTIGPYSLPKRFSKYPYKAIWDDLEQQRESLTLGNIVSSEQLVTIGKLSGAEISYNLTGTLVYIGGNDQESISKVQGKLRVLLAFKKLLACPVRIQHVIYPEDHIEKQADNLKAETRYLANIDPVLASSTLFDRAMVKNNDLESAYKMMYSEGVSIRLCIWDPEKKFWVSLLGPRVPGRSGRKYSLGDRPVISTKLVHELPSLAEAFVRRDEIDPNARVEAWMNDVTNQIESNSEMLTEPKNAAPSTTAEKSLIDRLDPAPQDLSMRGIHEEKPATSNGAGSSTKVPVITWSMPPLIPETSDETSSNHSSLFMRYLQAGVKDFEPSAQERARDQTIASPQQTAPRQQGVPAQIPEAAASTSQVEHGVSSQLPATDTFIQEIETAMVEMLATGPYRRGKIELRAEFGRVLLGGLDRTALAFNNIDEPSNGWDKLELLNQLGIYFGEPKDMIHCTRILTTHGGDMEDMIKVRTGPSRLWQEEPSHAWTVYSIQCALEFPGKLRTEFVVDLRDDPNSENPFSYSVRSLPGKSGPLPIFVHAIRRNWDLEIRLSHVNREGKGRAVDFIAKKLLQSLSVSHSAVGGPELRFAVPKGRGVEIVEARVLTKWRYPSLNNKSILEITEVQQMELGPCTDLPVATPNDEWDIICAKPWTQPTSQRMRTMGAVPRWYDAAVMSSEAEALFRENEIMELGEKAKWTPDELKARGILATVYGPALCMLREMDHIGRSDSNGLSNTFGKLLKKGNNSSRTIPGLMPNTAPRTVPGMTSPSPSRGRSRRRKGDSGAPKPQSESS